MPRYLVTFDIDTRAMRADLVDRQGMTLAAYAVAKTRLYKSEIPAALSACGSIRRKQASVYYLDSEQGLDATIQEFRRAVADHSPTFCRFVRSVVVSPFGQARDITRLVATR